METLYHCIIALLTHMPFSICGTTVAKLNSILLRRWLCYYHPAQTHLHKLMLLWNDLYAAHISSLRYGNFVLTWNVLMRIAASWCCLDIFRRTRITLLKCSQLMQSPFSYLRKQVPFEVTRSTEHTGYLLYTDLLCFGWAVLNENTPQRVFATYLSSWTTLKLNWNV